jgi:16S rRNA (uracil1498-N3)-methyltransferase
MQIFYAPGINGKNYILDRKESHHCIRVLRMKKDSPVRLIDGRGNLYEGVISDPDQIECRITINNIITDFEKRPYRLHIAISPLKNPERFEWFVEKSVEIGVDEITPVICKNTEKQIIKHERINNIIISAMKQSLKADLTILNEPVSFSRFISEKLPGIKLIAHCNQGIERSGIAGLYSRGSEAIILIGPEGDFSEEEVISAVKMGFASVHLGTSRLRTETAAIAACHSFSLLNQ